jgi:hypothetical protein
MESDDGQMDGCRIDASFLHKTVGTRLVVRQECGKVECESVECFGRGSTATVMIGQRRGRGQSRFCKYRMLERVPVVRDGRSQRGPTYTKPTWSAAECIEECGSLLLFDASIGG